MKKIISLLLVVAVFLGGCTHGAAKQLAIPLPSAIGGFEMTTDSISCTAVANGKCKYTRFHSNADGMTVEYYASESEILMLYTQNGRTMYYTEAVQEPVQYDNPLSTVYDALRQLDFLLQEQSDERYIYEAIKTEQIVDSQQIPYTVYTIQTQWTDGNTYIFKYYEYSDGAILISAEAPGEINPLLMPSTPWVIDLANSCIRNTQSNQSVAFTVTQTSTGQALPPNGGNTQVTENETHIYAYVDANTKTITKLKYEDGADVSILYTANIQKPILTTDMVPMDSRTLQVAMMLIYTIESLLIV